MSSNTRKALLLSFLVLLIGSVGFALLMQKGPSPERRMPPPPARTVEIQIAQFAPQKPAILALGRVRSASAFDLAVQVGGRVLATADPLGLKSGLRLERGDLICLVDTADYSLELRRLSAQLKLAEESFLLAQESTELALTELKRLEELERADNASRKALEQARLAWIARKEKELSLASQIGEQGSLALSLEAARLKRERCELRAPFDCELSSGSLVAGSLVSPGMVVARLENLEQLEVQVELRHGEAQGLPDADGSEVMLYHSTGSNRELLGSGRFVHLGRSLDPQQQTREARIAVRGDQNLLPGMLVEVEFTGRSFNQSIRIPRRSLQENGEVLLWKDARLERRAANVIYADREWAYLNAGPADGDTLVLTAIQDALPGIPLKLKGQKDPESGPAGKGGKGGKGKKGSGAEGARP